ncbi:MAG TPA: hypothetical protein VII49_07545 [Rhizomicrobium sp.]
MRVFIAIVLACGFLGGCSVWPVNQDPAGMNYRRDANRIIMALQTYRQQRGAFPSDLGALVPGWLPELPDGPKLQYDPHDGALSYHYTPSWPQLRPVWCTSVGNTTNWRCAEHLI